MRREEEEEGGGGGRGGGGGGRTTHLRHRLRTDFHPGHTHQRDRQRPHEWVFRYELDPHAHGPDDLFDLDPDGCSARKRYIRGESWIVI